MEMDTLGFILGFLWVVSVLGQLGAPKGPCF